MVDQWLERQDEVLNSAEKALSEKQGEGKSGGVGDRGRVARRGVRRERDWEDEQVRSFLGLSFKLCWSRFFRESSQRDIPSLRTPTALSNRLWRIPDSDSAILPSGSTDYGDH